MATTVPDARMPSPTPPAATGPARSEAWPEPWARVKWQYDRAELIADGAVHLAGIALGIAGALVLAGAAVRAGPPAPTAALLIYGSGLLTVLWLSAVYNLWPISPTKWVLRRFDHAAIYLLIAATYTPFLIRAGQPDCRVLLGTIWATAGAGMVLKIACPGRFDRLAILLYLGLGWSGLIVHEGVAPALPAASVRLLLAGGALYSGGVIFHLWETLRFQNAIWHAFVLAAAACHFAAVLALHG